ncbi:glutaredoxin family protein [Candidatus Halobeggiatoa sp. HSG11]|nr:glutaredoxin family protein [Candidatus Halobeggiatoa sp. HSG11]
MTDKPALTLYIKVGCHLCEKMKQQLDILQQQYEFSLNLVDIEADSYLKLRYGERIPVLAIGEREICHYHLNNDLLMECFK